MEPDKPFKSYDEQIEILKKRNVIIPNHEDAVTLLSTFSYYSLINGYKDLFPESRDMFTIPISLYDFFHLFMIDKNLNTLFFKYIIRIEKELKTHISYKISEKYGVITYLNSQSLMTPNDYLCRKNYKSTQSRDNILKKIIKYASESKNESINHYKNHHNHIPCWILINGISLGVTIELYSLLRKEDKDVVCTQMVKTSILQMENKKEFFSKGIKILRKYRNNIAHGNRTFCNLVKEELPKNQVLALSHGEIKETEYKNGIGKNDIFAVSLIIVSILNKAERKTFIKEIDHIFNMVTKINFSTGQSIFEIMRLPNDFIKRLNTIAENL